MYIRGVALTGVLTSMILIQSGIARPVLQMAIQDNVGCHNKQDLVEIRQAGHMNNTDISATARRVSELIKQKVNTGKCFIIHLGQTAIGAPEWQNSQDAFSGILVFSTESGYRFYSSAWDWKYAGEITTPVEPPN